MYVVNNAERGNERLQESGELKKIKNFNWIGINCLPCAVFRRLHLIEIIELMLHSSNNM